MTVTTERSNRAIDTTVDYLIQKDGVVTAQSIYDELNRQRKMILADDRPLYYYHVSVDDILDAIEDILQHSYDVIV